MITDESKRSHRRARRAKLKTAPTASKKSLPRSPKQHQMLADHGWQPPSCNTLLCSPISKPKSLILNLMTNQILYFLGCITQSLQVVCQPCRSGASSAACGIQSTNQLFVPGQRRSIGACPKNKAKILQKIQELGPALPLDPKTMKNEGFKPPIYGP